MASNNHIQIGDQCYIKMEFNDQPFYLSPGSFNLFIIQHANQKLPSLKLEILNDPTGRVVNLFQAGDGTVLNVEIGRETTTTSRVFNNRWRLFGPPKLTPMNGGYNIKIIALLDCFDYLNQRVPVSYSNLASSQVIQDITGRFAFKTADYRGVSTIDPTNDAQSWRPATRSWADFMTYLTDHAWADDTSAFASAVDENRVLYFKNLSKVVSRVPQARFAYANSSKNSTQLTYPVLQHKMISSAGPLNNTHGYSYKTGQTQQDGSFKTMDSTKLVLPSNYLEMNKEIKDSIGTGEGKYTYRPMDAGNVSEVREQAFYQNARIRKLYTSGYYILTEALTDEDLFSTVLFEPIDPVTRDVSNMYKGIFIVAVKVRAIVGARYFEKIQLMASGRATDAYGQLV